MREKYLLHFDVCNAESQAARDAHATVPGVTITGECTNSDGADKISKRCIRASASMQSTGRDVTTALLSGFSRMSATMFEHDSR